MSNRIFCHNPKCVLHTIPLEVSRTTRKKSRANIYETTYEYILQEGITLTAGFIIIDELHIMYCVDCWQKIQNGQIELSGLLKHKLQDMKQ